MIFKDTMKSPIGNLWIYEENNKIIEIGMKEDKEKSILKKTDLIIECEEQLNEYFLQKRKTFDIPLNPKGTEFQRKVWQSLLNIPYGETRSYGDIAKSIGNDKASRAVGGANNKNPILIMIPCHRVIGSKGNLVGYGLGLPIKEKLLQLEKDKFYKYGRITDHSLTKS